MTSPGLIDTLLHSCQFGGSFKDFYDVKTKLLDTEIFPHHTLADLNSSTAFIVLFSQQKPLL